jgi:GAF domain-containing protein
MTESPMDRELQNLRGENQRLRGLLPLLSDLSLRITSTLDLPTVLQDVIDAACVLTGARYGALGVFDDFGRIQGFVTHGISLEDRERIGNLPQGWGCWAGSRTCSNPCAWLTCLGTPARWVFRLTTRP